MTSVRRTRRHRAGTVGLAVLAVASLGACTPEPDGRLFPDATDLARAQSLWADPWIAPSETTTVHPSGPAPRVERAVAGRSYRTTAPPRDVVVTEVQAALATGWLVEGAECAPDEQGVKGRVTAHLARASDVGVVTARVTASVTSAAEGVTSVGLTASAPHHLDRLVPLPRPVPFEVACRASANATTSPAAPAVPSEQPAPTLSGDASPLPTWPKSATVGLADAAKAANADPGLTSLDLTISSAHNNGESGPRDAAKAGPKTVAAPDGLPGTVTALLGQGWNLTYAGCLGLGAPNVAELSRTVGERRAVLRLVQVAASAPAVMPGEDVEAVAVISTPGFSPEASDPVTDPCFAESKAPTGFSHKGIPSLGPTRMLPLQD